MSKYVIAEFCETTGMSLTIVKAESKLHALQDYFDVETDPDGHLYLDAEALVADQERELGYDIGIIKVGKKTKTSDEEDAELEYDEGYTSWPFPEEKPE
jgi:hypothetical protein